jgi:hypothetical protein
MDSATTEKIIPSGEKEFYMTIYNFDKSRKNGWTAFNLNKEKISSGKITWTSDKEYTEKVSDATGKSEYEVITFLNDSGRIIKKIIKSFDNTGHLIRDDEQEFHLDKSQQIEFYKTIHQIDGSTDITNFEYLGSDKTGNPVKLIISKKNREPTSLVTMDYVYYE